ncbi:MAG: hypothetical protein ACE5LU_08105 [Anaerolineae bacterium]
MLKEAVFEWLVEQILDKALASLDRRSDVQRVRRLLADGPARASLTRAVRAAYAAVEAEHPQLTLDIFTKTFFLFFPARLPPSALSTGDRPATSLLHRALRRPR